MVESVLRSQGRELTLHRGERQTPLRAFLQPVAGKTATLAATPGGMTDGARYVFIGPVMPMLQPDDTLSAGDDRWRVIRCDIIFGTDGPLWQWAVCAREGEDTLWT